MDSYVQFVMKPTVQTSKFLETCPWPSYDWQRYLG